MLLLVVELRTNWARVYDMASNCATPSHQAQSLYAGFVLFIRELHRPLLF